MKHFTNGYIDHELHEYDSMSEKVGGTSPHKQRLVNMLLFIFVVVSFTVGIFFLGTEWVGKVAIEVAVLLISIKLGFYMHNAVKFNHYSFWVYAAMENRLLEIKKQVGEQTKLLEELREKAASK